MLFCYIFIVYPKHTISSDNSNLTQISQGTITNVVTPSRADIYSLRKIGKLAIINIINVNFGQLSGETKVATLSYKPFENRIFGVLMDRNGNLNNSKFVSAYVNRDDNGLYVVNVNELLYGTLMYLTND